MRRTLILTWLFGAILALVLSWTGSAAAHDSTRQTTLIIPYTEYEWWLLSWADNSIVCRVLVDHEGLPTEDEVLAACGYAAANIWINTPPCQKIAKGSDDTSGCPGLYLHLVSSRPTQKELVVELPPAQVWVNLDGCTPKPPENLCTTLPGLVLTGDEPLPNEKITAIRGTYAGQSFHCPGSVCRLQLRPTPLTGDLVEFWAESSFGDTSEHFTAQVRVIDSGVSSSPGASGWYVDVISSQWTGAPIASCSRIWEALPPVGGPPPWLSTPESSELLASGSPFVYLAGRLISNGVVDASTCSSNGMLPNGYANACGLGKARPMLMLWQNQFDKSIVSAAQETGVPAQLLKNLFAQESQFWPGEFKVPYEFGLGQITDQGADSVLLWNDAFYEQFCPLVLAESTCSKDYLHLKPEEQALLRGAVASQANANCTGCIAGIDLSNADFSIKLFAQTLQANCAQVGQTVYNATALTPGFVATYEDLWRFTVANYHAGSGCVSFAIHQSWLSTGKLTWDDVATRFTEPCRGVVPYVNKITGK